MMRGRWRFWVVLLLAMGFQAVGASPGQWEADIRAFERRDEAEAGQADADLLLFGSSSFRMWKGVEDAFPGVRVVNRGFGGSELSDLIEHFERVVPRHQPRVLCIYGGDNDLANKKSPDRVVADFKALARQARRRLPGVRVVFFAVKPSPSRASLVGAQEEANRRIRRWARVTPGVEFLDVATPLLDAGGQPDPAYFVADRLHLNRAGYEAWEAQVRARLSRWVGRQRVAVPR